MTDHDQEDARQPNGRYGKQNLSDAELRLEPTADGPALWQLDVAYVDGAVESFLVEESGKLPKPVKSESLYLYSLLGFKATRFASQIDLTVEEAIADPGDSANLYPVFETTQGMPTALMGNTVGFRPQS
ncbi:hypothetical protein [Leifsonia sp. Leaf264]|uniref:hypothetical protein n=1 Tax=Leifsonia sp. Leaf264 TaxID=1736314 RepID=UPI0006FD255F|nr:hypothetical protein [Leifsonia sp. Leaf264]KQO98401.1 hypothetical protein ASF30_10090 [Leifsonia sp. Leaf264]